MKSSTLAAIGIGALGGAMLASQCMHERYDLRRKHALITGGSRGLGLALARELVARGVRVSLVARDQEELNAAVEDLRGRGGAADSFVCDLVAEGTDGVDPVLALVSEVEKKVGPIDLLINNAGTILVGPVGSMTLDDIKNTMKLNFMAPIRMAMAISPRMGLRGGGKIINISSVGGKYPVPHLAAYSASKFALAAYFGAALGDLHRVGISVTTAYPGLMRTGSTQNAMFKGDHKKEYALFALQASLPGMSMSAARAARKIINAAVRGQPEVIVGLPARLIAGAYALSPNLMLTLNALSGRVLPSDQSQHLYTGEESESAVTQSPLTFLGRKAAADLNQAG